MEQSDLSAARRRAARPSLAVSLAHGQGDILEAQRLRYRVFAGEMGANLPSRIPGVDHDVYDPHCDHLIVRVDDVERIEPGEDRRGDDQEPCDADDEQ